MKKILITGKDSYVGTSLIKWLKNKPEDYHIQEISVRGNDWKKYDFSKFDTVFHVAGIAHNSSNPKLKDLYYKINRDLTIDVALKAKESGVKQFIFMSSMIIYGNNSNGKTKITENTIPNPDNFYGNSKYEAEKRLQLLNDNNFNIVILRPPMIYGKNSKGNYPLLSKFAQKTFIFPNFYNKRSMIYIDNFCEFVYLIMNNNEQGVFHPQNQEIVQTSEMVRIISNYYNNKVIFTSIGNKLINQLLYIDIFKKVFGDFYYDLSLSEYEKGNYQINTLIESIILTEREN